MADSQTLSTAEARMIGEAALFAAHAHGSQMRADRGDPYLVHLAEVATMVSRLEPYDPVLVAAAWLHDTVEDTGVREPIIRERFGDQVAGVVMDVTDPPALKGQARRERQVTHTAQAGTRVKLLKLADKTSNIEELLDLPTDRFDAEDNARYLDWSRRVVDVCRGLAPELEARFDRSAARLEAEIELARQRQKDNSSMEPAA